MNIGRNLNSLLYDKHISARELARRVGVCEGTISKIKVNERKPSIELAQKIAAELGVTVDELLTKEV